jgi:hypothetical protein
MPTAGHGCEFQKSAVPGVQGFISLNSVNTKLKSSDGIHPEKSRIWIILGLDHAVTGGRFHEF